LSIIATGKNFDLILLIVIWVTAYITINLAKKGRKVTVKRLPGLDAIDEAMGRATEMGKPVMMIPGMAGINSTTATGDQIAGFSVLNYVATQTAKLDIPLITAVGSYINLPFAEDAVKSAYISEGREEAYKPEYVRFVAQGQYAVGAAVMGILARERAAANIMVGYFWSESLALAEAGATVGAIQLGATSNSTQIPYFVACCDYTLIGDEIFAAGAYLSKDPQQLGSLEGGDISKAIVLALIVLTALTLLMGSNAIKGLISW
jgi:hypothetical protein